MIGLMVSDRGSSYLSLVKLALEQGLILEEVLFRHVLRGSEFLETRFELFFSPAVLLQSFSVLRNRNAVHLAVPVLGVHEQVRGDQRPG